ncbi:MAG: hypothetical protein V8R01_02065 [Bacilli bacterium]
MEKNEDTKELNIEDIVIDKEIKENEEKKSTDLKSEEASLEQIVKNDYQEKTIVQMNPVSTNKMGIAQIIVDIK